MLQGKRYRIYPNKEQKALMEKHFGSCRFVYNKFLEIKSLMYKKFRISLSEFELNNYLLVLKEIYPFLKEVNTQSLQQASRNLNSAFNHFFKDEFKYPQKKHKKDHHFSFQVPQHYSINFATSQILFPKLGWIKVKMHRQLFKEMELESDIIEHDNNAEFLRTVTVSRTPTGKYYISILTEDGEKLPEKQEYTHATMVGVDVGINTFAACSNGEKIDNPRFLKASLQRLKFLQREVSRKIKGSNNWKKAVRKLALIHEKISNQRHDFQHKVSNRLIGENQAIAVETLNVKGMIKNHKLAQAISDSAWYSFVQKLMYKAEWVGKTIIKIGMFEPSSKNCNVCGYHNSELTLDIREWQCPECGTLHDRDINAAINIKKIAVGTTV